MITNTMLRGIYTVSLLGNGTAISIVFEAPRVLSRARYANMRVQGPVSQFRDSIWPLEVK